MNANLTSARFNSNDFTGADLSGAQLEDSRWALQIDFTNANLTGILCGAALCQGSQPIGFAFATFANTLCPDGVTIGNSAADCGFTP